jgi:predicted membrane channel-forming protein YqfA (hemolysin III family)
MALSYKSRRRWALIILVVGLPIYIIVATSVVGLIERPNILIELLIYVVLGIVWIMPFKSVFKGIGQPDPDADPDQK